MTWSFSRRTLKLALESASSTIPSCFIFEPLNVFLHQAVNDHVISDWKKIIRILYYQKTADEDFKKVFDIDFNTESNNDIFFKELFNLSTLNIFNILTTKYSEQSHYFHNTDNKIKKCHILGTQLDWLQIYHKIQAFNNHLVNDFIIDINPTTKPMYQSWIKSLSGFIAQIVRSFMPKYEHQTNIFLSNMLIIDFG